MNFNAYAHHTEAWWIESDKSNYMIIGEGEDGIFVIKTPRHGAQYTWNKPSKRIAMQAIYPTKPEIAYAILKYGAPEFK